MGAACPAMADVNGVRYALSGPVELLGVEDNHVPFAAISASNSFEDLTERTAYAIAGIDPRILLVARGHPRPDAPGEYRELWSLADDGFPVVFCRFMSPDRQSAQSEWPVTLNAP